tara:strand:- start:413 stop:1603 length:1191 start_codon:yes stop_codon:yes gene_type:complete
MKILFLTFYFEPDLCAGSFRNSSLLQDLHSKIKKTDSIDVISTKPNRYDSYKVNSKDFEKRFENLTIRRINLPNHKGGIISQIKLFIIFYNNVFKITKNNKYDLVFASSSRLFTAFLGARLARKNKAKLFLDIRDIFRETITDVYKQSKVISFFLNLIIPFFEKYTFNRASAINIVSPGFKDYFKKHNYGENAKFYYNTNGIDEIFLEKNPNQIIKKNKLKKKIVYAGNIGSSQDLDKTLPATLDLLGKNYELHIYGDGARKKNLISELKNNNCSNIFIHNPIERNKLKEIYNDADILFFQLSKLDAFLRVIPSKLFEYSAFTKPIVAVVDGYCKDFINSNLKGVFIADPEDVNQIVKIINDIDLDLSYDRSTFINEFSRSKINSKLSNSILEYLK